MPQTAEIIQTSETLQGVFVVPEMQEDLWSTKQAERFIHSVGSTAFTGVEVIKSYETSDEPVKSENLRDGIHWAAWGNSEARRMIETDVLTDMIERTIKSGHVMKVGIEIGQDGELLQHGQRLKSVYAMALRHASESWQIEERTKAETRNGFRIKDLLAQGALEDYCFVVISRCADNMTDEALTDAGFFVDTMSCSIQSTTLESGGLTMESAFVAGVGSPGGEQHDKNTVEAMGAELGVDFHDKTAAEIIDTPILIHKSLMPNGVIDLVKLYDSHAGGTFFGEDKERQDYLQYLGLCRQREADLRPLVTKITDQLIDEASAIQTPIQAVKRLHELSQENMVEKAVEDTTINPKVFGEVAARHIESARLHTQNGNHELAEQARQNAQRTAVSSSCPSSMEKELLESSNRESGEKSNSGTESISLDGKIRCIKCKESVPKKQVVKKECWQCPKCNFKVDICSGKTLNEGKIEPHEQEVATVLEFRLPRKKVLEQSAA